VLLDATIMHILRIEVAVAHDFTCPEFVAFFKKCLLEQFATYSFASDVIDGSAMEITPQRFRRPLGLQKFIIPRAFRFALTRLNLPARKT
jgi:hypothetical protein